MDYSKPIVEGSKLLGASNFGKRFAGIDVLAFPELDILGFFIPWGMVMGVLGFLLAWVVTLLLEHYGLTRYIWHLPLFFVALVLFCSCLLGLIFAP